MEPFHAIVCTSVAKLLCDKAKIIHICTTQEFDKIWGKSGKLIAILKNLIAQFAAVFFLFGRA